MQNVSGKVVTFLEAAFAKTNIKYQFNNDYIMLSISKADKVQQRVQNITGVVNDEMCIRDRDAAYIHFKNCVR